MHCSLNEYYFEPNREQKKKKNHVGQLYSIKLFKTAMTESKYGDNK